MFVNSFDYSKVTNWDDAFTLPLQAYEQFFILFLESQNKHPPRTSNSALLRDRIEDALFLARLYSLFSVFFIIYSYSLDSLLFTPIRVI